MQRSRLWEIGAAISLAVVVIVAACSAAWTMHYRREWELGLPSVLTPYWCGDARTPRDISPLARAVARAPCPYVDFRGPSRLTNHLLLRVGLLTTAARFGSASLVAALLQKGADPNGRDGEGNVPIVAAAGNPKFNTVTKLLAAGATVRVTGGPFNDTPMTAAVCSERVDLIRELIAEGADVNGANGNQMTPLMYAARWRDAEIIRLLLAAGADPKRHTRDGFTAFRYATIDETNKHLDEATLAALQAADNDRGAHPWLMLVHGGRFAK